MKVIFTQKHGSSSVDDIRNVKPGYFRYLLTHEKAVVATPTLIEEAQKRNEQKREKLRADQEAAKLVAEKLAEISIEFIEKANEQGHLFGSVTEQQIAEKLSEASKVEVEKEMIRLPGHLKETGEHKVKVHLTEGVDAYIQVNVKPEENQTEA